MRTKALWATSDTRPRFKVHATNLIDQDLAEPDEWDAVFDRLRCLASEANTRDAVDSEAPPAETIRLLITFVAQARDQGMLPPTRVMPNEEAGIALEWSGPSFRRLWELDDRHKLEMSRFEGGRCVSRDELDLAALLPELSSVPTPPTPRPLHPSRRPPSPVDLLDTMHDPVHQEPAHAKKPRFRRLRRRK